MILAQIQQAAEAVGSDSSSPLGIYLAAGVGVLILVDRILHILSSRGLLVNGKKKRNGNPHNGRSLDFITPDQWNAMGDQMQALYAWHEPDRPNQPGQKIWWMPWAEFETLMTQANKTSEDSTKAINMLVQTLETLIAAGRARDIELTRHREILEELRLA